MQDTVFLSAGDCSLRDLDFSGGLADTLWEKMKDVPNLFDDLMLGERSVLDNLILDPTTFWMGLYEDGPYANGEPYLFGVAYTTLVTANDAGLHLIIFDAHVKKPERFNLFYEAVRWLFKEFPAYNRLSLDVPFFYNKTIQLAKRVGFKEEGRKRGVYLMRGAWVDEINLGLTRAEVEG